MTYEDQSRCHLFIFSFLCLHAFQLQLPFRQTATRPGLDQNCSSADRAHGASGTVAQRHGQHGLDTGHLVFGFVQTLELNWSRAIQRLRPNHKVHHSKAKAASIIGYPAFGLTPIYAKYLRYPSETIGNY